MQKLSLDLLTVTEKAALSSLEWVGRGDKNAADNAATEAMRTQLRQMDFSGEIVIGEGELDHAPMLYIGEKFGKSSKSMIDIAVDPIEGTTPTVNGQENGITVIAAAPQGTLLHAPDIYMMKIVTGPEAKGMIDIQAPLIDNIRKVAAAKSKKTSDMKIAIQNRPRHDVYVQAIREIGAKVYLFDNNDIIASLKTCLDNGDIDLMFNIGGAPEGIISAVAIKALGGEMQAQLMPFNNTEVERCHEMGIKDVGKSLSHQELFSSQDCVFSATGVTDSYLLKGIEKIGRKYSTHSILITGKDKRIRFINSIY